MKLVKTPPFLKVSSTYPPNHLFESWRKGKFLMELEVVSMVSGYTKYLCESLLKISSRSNIKKLYKDPYIIQLSSWILGGQGCSCLSWRGCQGIEISKGRFTETFIKIQHPEAHQDSIYPPRLFLESWRTGMFLMEIEVGSEYSKYPREALQKVSSRSIIRKLVKTLPILQVSSWSLAGEGCSWYAVDGVRVVKILQGSFPESFIKI